MTDFKGPEVTTVTLNNKPIVAQLLLSFFFVHDNTDVLLHDY